MTKPHHRFHDLSRLCAQIHDDDGADPRYDKLADRRETRVKPDTKDQQLAKQIRVALGHALRARGGDPLLSTVSIDRVEPAPDATRFAVYLASMPGARTRPGADVLARCRELRGVLRAEIAEAITRKRVPDLIFKLAPSGAEEVGDE